MSLEWKPFQSALGGTVAANRFGAVSLLVLVAAWAYFANLHLSLLEGSEGLYAGIAGEMKRHGEFFDLTYQGLPYFNKPPFFFWLLSLSTSIWGDNEVALRVPGSLAAVGTIALVYLLGVRLMSPTAGFWAALVVATTHVFLWYGRSRIVRFDLDLLRHAGHLFVDSGPIFGTEFQVVPPRVLEHGPRGDAQGAAWVLLAAARHGGLRRHPA